MNDEPRMPMTPADMDALAQSHGFAKAYCLRPAPLADAWAALYTQRPPHTQNLCLNPAAAFPSATCIVLLIRAYRPFPLKTGLPGYYVASNAGYHAANALCKELTARGCYAQRLELPLPALVTQAGLGVLRKNALLDIADFGTRTALFTLVTDACPPQEESLPVPPLPCGACTACAAACPAGAIHPVHGLCASRCLRADMENAPLPVFVMEHMPGLLGCELCQFACPHNDCIPPRQPTPEERVAFDIAALLRENTAPARALVGKNMCGGGRLTAQAAVIAGRTGRTDLLDELEPLLLHPRPAVRQAAAWAIQKLTVL